MAQRVLDRPVVLHLSNDAVVKMVAKYQRLKDIQKAIG